MINKKYVSIIFLVLFSTTLIGCEKTKIINNQEISTTQGTNNSTIENIPTIDTIKEVEGVLEEKDNNDIDNKIIEDIENTKNIKFEEVTDTVQETPVVNKDRIQGFVDDKSIESLFSFTIDKESYSKNDILNIDIENLANLEISTINPYKLEAFKNDDWETVSLDLVFTSEIVPITGTEPYKQEILLSNLDSGIYRISKDIYIEAASTGNIKEAGIITNSIEFNVE